MQSRSALCAVSTDERFIGVRSATFTATGMIEVLGLQVVAILAPSPVLTSVRAVSRASLTATGRARPTSPERPRPTFYGDGRASLRNEDVIEIEVENAGRRCGVCRTGRGWRRFELVRPAGREPVLLCGGCRARFGDDPPVGRKPSSPVASVPAMAEPLAPPNRYPGNRGPDQHPDRLRAALGKLPGSFSTAMAARAAGINSRRALARLQDLERRGEVRRVGKRWSSESPPSDVAAAREEPETVVPAAEVIARMKTENPSSAQDILDVDEEHTAHPRCRSPGRRTS